MDINPKIAETIVSNIKGVLKHEINLFDTSGTIIASTDKSRIGTGHDGARLAVALKHTIAIDNEHQFEGAKNGINVPVMINGSVVAVIGITGKRSEVEPFGNIIKKMTEILIRENIDQVTRFDRRMMMSNLINILTSSSQDPGLIDYLSSVLHLDLGRPKFVIVGHGQTHDDTITAQNNRFNALSELFHEMPQSLFSMDTQEIRMLIDKEDVHDLTGFLRTAQEKLAESDHDVFRFGIADPASSCEAYPHQYEQACEAANWLQFSHEQSIAYYHDLDYGVFIASIPAAEAKRFVDHVFNGLDEQQIEDFHTTFAAYRDFNGSIIHAANKLFLHKNTLQNRLNKIASVTGYNPRILKDYTVLDTAFTLRSYLKQISPSYRSEKAV